MTTKIVRLVIAIAFENVKTFVRSIISQMKIKVTIAIDTWEFVDLVKSQ